MNFNLTGLRTFALAAAAAILGIAETFDWTQVLEGVHPGTVTIVMAGIMAVMRAITKTPPGLPKA